MKKLLWILLAAFLIGGATYTTAEAQGRGNERRHSNRGQNRGHHGHQKNKYKKNDRHHRDRRDAYRQERRYDNRHEQRRSSYHDRRYDRHPVAHRPHPKYRKPAHRPPHWARAHRYQAKHPVYFRDYHMFYDPYRNGYVYYRDNRWLFSRSLPAFVANIDLGRAHIQIMSDIPVRARPERYYQRYARRSPAQININIPLPHLPRF